MAAFDFKPLTSDQLLMVHNECAERLGMLLIVAPKMERKMIESATGKVLSLIMPQKRPWPFREHPAAEVPGTPKIGSGGTSRGVTLGGDEDEPQEAIPEPPSPRAKARKKFVLEPSGKMVVKKQSRKAIKNEHVPAAPVGRGKAKAPKGRTDHNIGSAVVPGAVRPKRADGKRPQRQA